MDTFNRIDVDITTVHIAIYAPHSNALEACMLHYLTQHSQLMPQHMLVARLLPTCSALSWQHYPSNTAEQYIMQAAQQASHFKWPDMHQSGDMSCILLTCRRRSNSGRMRPRRGVGRVAVRRGLRRGCRAMQADRHWLERARCLAVMERRPDTCMAPAPRTN